MPADRQPAPCETTGRRAAPALRPYVVGYGGFRSGSGAAVRHRMFPLTVATAVIDLTGAARVVTGARATPMVFERTAWASGVTIGFTPAGVRALLDVAPVELVGRTAPLEDLLDPRLPERLAAVSTWDGRFALLDEVLRQRLRPVAAGRLVTAAWWQLQGDAVRVAAVAERLAVSRRHLEKTFNREIGLTPGTVGRIARFQRAIGLLATRRAILPAVAAGYADQAHLTRDVRAMSGLTPAGLFAFLQYRSPARR